MGATVEIVAVATTAKMMTAAMISSSEKAERFLELIKRFPQIELLKNGMLGWNDRLLRSNAFTISASNRTNGQFIFSIPQAGQVSRFCIEIYVTINVLTR